MAGKKVLVRSRHREALARTVINWTRGKDGRPEQENGYRQFVNFECYMTPKEAAFLVDSEENMRYIDSGQPAPYYYPAGAPLIVDENFKGPLSPPLAGQGVVANNQQQADAARKALAAGEAALAAKEMQVTEDAKALKRTANSGAQKIARPEGLGDDDEEISIDKSVPASASRTSGGVPLKISNPDLNDGEELELSQIPQFT
jgi:hypothetical protein